MFFYIVLICGFISTIILLMQKRMERDGKTLGDGILVTTLIFYWFSIIVLLIEAFVRLGAAYIIDTTTNLPPRPGDLARGFNSLFTVVAMWTAMKVSLKNYRWLKIKSSLKKIHKML